jgi:hypothetical protein
MTQHTFGCGCSVEIEGAEGEIEYCALHAAADTMFKVLEGTMAVLDRIPNHHTMSVNEFIEQSGFTARASEAILKART